MSLLPVSILLPLSLLLLHAVALEDAPNTKMVSQTPHHIRAMEGAELTMECRFNISGAWFVRWYKTNLNEKNRINNEVDRIIITIIEPSGLSTLTLKKADVADSGTYFCTGGNIGESHTGSGTTVTIEGITDLMVNQTPAHLCELEGSNITIECRFKTVRNYSTMYVTWYKQGPENETIGEGGSVVKTQNLENGFASLTLKNVNVTDAGTYLCEVGSRARNLSGNGNGTRVDIVGITDLKVNQTPSNITISENSTFTINCTFRTRVNNHNNVYVKWYKKETERELPEREPDMNVQELEGFASLTLKKVNVTDAGNYICQVWNRARNHSQAGNGTYVNIIEKKKEFGSTYVIIGAAMGTLLSLLVLGVLLWKCKRRSKEIPQSQPQAEMDPIERTRPSPPPADDITYANLNFQPKRVQPAEDVVYTTVKVWPKQADGRANDVYAKINRHHR